MSLTSEFELSEMYKKPVKKQHKPNFLGDRDICDYTTGHCTNTSACNDCTVYQSVSAVRAYQRNLEGK